MTRASWVSITWRRKLIHLRRSKIWATKASSRSVAGITILLHLPFMVKSTSRGHSKVESWAWARDRRGAINIVSERSKAFQKLITSRVECSTCWRSRDTISTLTSPTTRPQSKVEKHMRGARTSEDNWESVIKIISTNPARSATPRRDSRRSYVATTSLLACL